MSKVYCIRTRQKGKHLTHDECEDLEEMVNQNNKAPKKDMITQKELVRRLGVSLATLIR